jgi:hypothetical protein
MEAYGKGAHPYYTASGVINGWPETKYKIGFYKNGFTGKLNDPANPRGLKHIVDRDLLCGVWTWSHGGGWDGPFIKNEIWTDLNTYVVSQWGQNPEKKEEEIFYEFATKLGLTGYQADLFRRLNVLTIEGVRKGHMNSYTNNNVWWTRDEYFSIAHNKKVIQQIIDRNKVEQDLAEKKEAVLSVTIPEEKGSFKRFCQIIGGRVITEFNYRYASDQQANIFVGIKLSHGEDELQSLIEKLSNYYHVDDLTDNELAKLHIRYMVGGKSGRVATQSDTKERIFQFEFPEYPGALELFLETLGEDWNITLFHYRNHGSALGQVLAGFEISESQELDFFRHLKTLNYHFKEETDNKAFKLFL